MVLLTREVLWPRPTRWICARACCGIPTWVCHRRNSLRGITSSRAWVDALKQRRRETGSFAPRKQRKFRHRALAATDMDRLAALVIATPDATLAELRDALRASAGLPPIWRAPHK